MTSRASCIRSRAWTSSAARAPWRATASTSAIGQVRAGQDDQVARAAGRGDRSGRKWASVTDAEDSRLYSPTCPRAAARGSTPDPSAEEPPRPVLAFIDEIVLPFLQSLYGAVGYVGVMLAMGDRVGDDPAPVGADPAVRRVPGLGPERRSSRSPGSRGTSGSWWSWRPSATRSARWSRTRSAPTAAGRSSSATAGTC